MKQITNIIYSDPKGYRLRELDFLRGCAIILVLMRHRNFFSHAQVMGWIGVDMFFVLSGFLVGGLLFREYLKFGYLRPGLFLIRRGFKIYPIYYLTYGLYLIPLIYAGMIDHTLMITDLLFFQNYFSGWGYAYAASWSLAVEEHFYIGFSLLLWLATRMSWISSKTCEVGRAITGFEVVTIIILISSLFLRIMTELNDISIPAKRFTMTHLRIDSLLFGVLIAYWYYYKNNALARSYKKYRSFLIFVGVAGLSWTPFIEPMGSSFVMTIGFSLLYISFGIILLAFLFTSNINDKLDRIFSKRISLFVARVGYSSYSIYVIHTWVNQMYNKVSTEIDLSLNGPIIFIITSGVSIGLGMVLTFRVENFFLKIRDRHFPSRVKNIILPH